jgi:hypothetical protein
MGDDVQDAVPDIAVGVLGAIDFPAQTCPYSAPFPRTLLGTRTTNAARR